MDVTGRVALVTGSGKRRVGWHVAAALADRGYALVVHYHTSAAPAAEAVEAYRARGVDDLSRYALDEAIRHLIVAIPRMMGA